MESFRTFIEGNLISIIFAYGLTFFTAGVVILIQRHELSKFRLAKYIWMLGSFGIVHGLAEWGGYIYSHAKPAAA
ncbi:MAG: hypothetical protein ACYC51_01365 [Thermoleophilia bacterium]